MRHLAPDHVKNAIRLRTAIRRTVRIGRLCIVLAGWYSVLCGSAHAASSPLRVPDTIAQRVAACTTCHGKEGRATSEGYFPRIAGKPAGYLYNQLVNFRDGRRHYPLMAYLVEHLTDSYLDEMAQYFAGLDLPYPPPQVINAPPQVLSRGEALVRRGDAARNIPACVQCHGDKLTGVVPSIPGLLGLPRDYLQAQLGHWKSGERRAQAPDCMAKLSARLTPEEVGAVTTWLALQVVPVDSRPAAALPGPLPVPCGGVPK
jgi:cytochrome c553